MSPEKAKELRTVKQPKAPDVPPKKEAPKPPPKK